MATSNPNSTPALPQIKQSDLKDPALSVLNRSINTMWQQIIAVSGGAGPVNIPNTVTPNNLTIPSQTTPPTDPNTVLTLGSANQLYTPQNVRNTVIPNSFPANYGGSGVGGGTPLPPTPTSSTEQIPVNIVCLGDSLTLGEYVHTPPPASFAPYQSYPGQLQSQIPCIVTNLGDFGGNGSTSSALLRNQVPRAQAVYDSTKLDIASIIIGTNDCILYGNSSTVTAGSFVVGNAYVITTIGSTNFTLIGASSNTVGLQFTAGGPGTGSGTATAGLQTLQTNVSLIVNDLQSTGYKCIVGTISPSNYTGSVNPTYQTGRTNYNSWVLGNSAGVTVSAGLFVIGVSYTILSVGSTNFTLIGAASNTVGLGFIATGVGSGSGTATVTLSATVVCDSGNDPTIANTANTEYFQGDQLHMFPAGYGVIAKNIAAAVQRVERLWDVNSPESVAVGSFASASYHKAGESLSINDFGASYAATADQNTNAINAAITAAIVSGKSVRFPDPYYNVHKFNVIPVGGQQGLRLWSDSNYSTSLGPATLLICDGGGTSWLKACVNVVQPNSGNTGPSFAASIYGMQIEGLYVQQTSGIGSGTLSGFLQATCFNGTTKNCGVITPPGGGRWSSGITYWQCGLNTVLENFSADTCATGISLGGSSADPITAESAEIQVINPGVQNCNSAGIGGAYAQYCKISGGFAIGCAVGFYSNGKENSWQDGYFSGNTIDIDMLNSVGPWSATVAATTIVSGGEYQIATVGTTSYTSIGASANTVGVYFRATGASSGTGTVYPAIFPDGQKLINCSFTSAVNIRNSVGSVLLANNFDTSSSLLIDSACSATFLGQHSSFPATSFVDNGVATYLASVQVGTTNPTTLPGITGQYYYYTSTSTLYICTVSGLGGSATWTAISSSAPTHLNLTYRAASTSTVTILTTDFMVATTLSSGVCTVNLPQASTCSGLLIGITNYNGTANLSNITPHSGDNIQKILSVLPISQYASTLLMSDGTSNWVIVALSTSYTGGTGITVAAVGSSATAYTITNSGVTALSTSGSGINVSAATGSVVITNTGVTALSTSGSGINVSAATGSVVITNTGVTSFNSATGALTGLTTLSAYKFRFGTQGLTSGAALSISTGLTTISFALCSLIGGSGPTEFLSEAWSGSTLDVWSSNTLSTATIAWMAIGN